MHIQTDLWTSPRLQLASQLGRQLVVILLLTTFISGCAVRRTVDDPIEPVNRAIFGFNEVLDKAVLEPVARGYDWVTPSGVKRSIYNFFENLSSPRKIVSAAAQGKGTDASIHVGRFLVNSTVGVLGLFDVAKHWELVADGDDFGVALGSYGIGPGPYLVLPLLGPSNVRDLFGTVVDGFLDPLSYLVNSDGDILIQAGARTVKVVEQRRRLIDAIEVGRKSSLDYYTFVQSSYQQSRLNQIYDGNLPPELRDPDSDDESDESDEGWVIVDDESETARSNSDSESYTDEGVTEPNQSE